MDEVAVELQKMIVNLVPSCQAAPNVDVPLGAGGLGMDSVSTVMLLLECESRWGVAFPAEMLEQQPLTVGRLIDHLRNAKQA
jgi:acyl carrier protein